MQTSDCRKDDHPRMRRKLSAGFSISAVTFAAIAMLVLSCGDAGVEPPPSPPAALVATAVTVTPGSATFSALGDTTRFTAEVRNQHGHLITGAAVAWTSSDASVAAVDASGQVTAASNGSATITAMSGSASGTAAVTVAQAVSAVTVSPAANTLLAFGDTVRLIAEATDANGHAMAASEFSWVSSDTLVARVDASGLVESVGDGEAVVTATASEVTGAAELRVVGTAPPTITYLDGAGNPATDNSSITDHRIKVSFEERVSFLSSERYEALTPSFARRMIELTTNNTNTQRGIFGFQVEVGIEDDKSFFLVTPDVSYPPGEYAVRVKHYVAAEQAATVLNSSVTDRYLSFIDREYSSFSTPDIDALCESAASGYFQLAYDDGRQDCVRIPQVVFTFTPRGGREMIESNFDPTSVIRIYFDSEVVYLSDSGSWHAITPEDVLDMVEIAASPYRHHDPQGDLVTLGGPIGLELVSVSHAGDRTVVTIDSPLDPKTDAGEVYIEWVNYGIMVQRFARPSDVSKIANSNSIESYLENVTTFYHGPFGAVYPWNSCDVEHRPQSTASYGRGHDIAGRELDVAFARNDILPGVRNTAFAGAMSDDIVTDRGKKFEKADPNTKYVIDAAFIVADPIVSNAVGDWRSRFNDIIANVNRVFQKSGVNVEVRVSVINPFSEYRQHLLCDVPALDNLFFKDDSFNTRSYGEGEQALLSELLPIVRKTHPADVIFAFIPSRGGGGGAAMLNPNGPTHAYSARWSSRGVIGMSEDDFASSVDRDRYDYGRAKVLAHELGHILGLTHDMDTITKGGACYDYSSGLVVPSGFGYGGKLSDLPVATIMAYAGAGQQVAIFSADKEVVVSELCDDIDYNWGFCGEHRRSGLPDSRVVRVGGAYKCIVADASNALQYAIGAVAQYSDVGIAPSDVWTVSNSMSAAELAMGR